MALQTELPGTKLILLDRIKLSIKQRQEERREMVEAFTKAENKYNARVGAIDYDLETLRRVQEQLTTG